MKTIQTFFYLVLFFSINLTVISCKNSEKEPKPHSQNSFSGYWIAKDFIDSIIVKNRINDFYNGSTEIIIPEQLKDSVTFINDDVDSGKYPFKIINDTLASYITKDMTEKAVIKNGNLNVLPLDERYHIQEYIKADSSLVQIAKKANLTVLHVLINRVLSTKKYTIDSSKNEITFTEDGKVQGLANFKSFYISINGDEANIEDMTAITFTSANGTATNLGISFKKDKIELYDLILQTQPDEKPYYKTGKELYSLKVIK